MKLMKAVVCFGTLAVAVASAGQRYNVTLSHPTVISGTALKAGDYRVEVDGNKATISNGKSTAEAPVKVEASERKYPATAVRYATAGERYMIDEIHVGGSKTKLVFDSAAQAAVR